MVQDRYWLPPRKAMLCRIAGTMFLLSALSMVLVIAFAGITPGASPYCGGGDGCVWKSQPVILLREEVRPQMWASATARRTFEAYVARPSVRLGLAGVDAIATGPFALLLLSVGLALRRLSGHGADAVAQSLWWLRLASLAAIVWALARPVHETLLQTLLSPRTPSGARLQISAYLGDIATGLLLAIAAYVAIWAVEAALQAQRDLDSII